MLSATSEYSMISSTCDRSKSPDSEGGVNGVFGVIAVLASMCVVWEVVLGMEVLRKSNTLRRC